MKTNKKLSALALATTLALTTPTLTPLPQAHAITYSQAKQEYRKQQQTYQTFLKQQNQAYNRYVQAINTRNDKQQQYKEEYQTFEKITTQNKTNNQTKQQNLYNDYLEQKQQLDQAKHHADTQTQHYTNHTNQKHQTQTQINQKQQQLTQTQTQLQQAEQTHQQLTQTHKNLKTQQEQNTTNQQQTPQYTEQQLMYIANQAYLEMLNKYRQANGIPILFTTPTLNQVAENYATTLKTNTEPLPWYQWEPAFKHSPEAGKYYSENIAGQYLEIDIKEDTPNPDISALTDPEKWFQKTEEMFYMYVNSEGHNANSLNHAHQAAGVGMSYSKNTRKLLQTTQFHDYKRAYIHNDTGEKIDTGNPSHYVQQAIDNQEQFYIPEGALELLGHGDWKPPTHTNGYDKGHIHKVTIEQQNENIQNLPRMLDPKIQVTQNNPQNLQQHIDEAWGKIEDNANNIMTLSGKENTLKKEIQELQNTLQQLTQQTNTIYNTYTDALDAYNQIVPDYNKSVTEYNDFVTSDWFKDPRPATREEKEKLALAFISFEEAEKKMNDAKNYYHRTVNMTKVMRERMVAAEKTIRAAR